ncbi:MAG: DUF2809 domain-containing protein, partial [Verrucomicrobiaceae bacterium]
MVEAVAGVSALQRARSWQLFWIVLVIGLGLLWRSQLVPMPPALVKYGGSALWALMVFLGCGFLFPRASTGTLALMAIAISCAVEFGQLYHAPWLDNIRRTKLGALALGSVFNWPDIPAYTAGVFAGAI